MPISGVEAHEKSLDPHTGYVLESVLQALGDILVAQGASEPGVLSIGVPGYVLMVSFDTPTRPIWKPISLVAIPSTAFLHKGDLLVGLGNGTYGILPVGLDGEILTANASETLGMRWEFPSTGTCPYGLDFSFDCDSAYVAVI